MENGVAQDILIAAWAKERPEEAAQFGMALPVPGTRRYFMKTLLHEWAVEHTDSFVAWLQQQPTDMIVSYLREIPVTAMSESQKNWCNWHMPCHQDWLAMMIGPTRLLARLLSPPFSVTQRTRFASFRRVARVRVPWQPSSRHSPPKARGGTDLPQRVVGTRISCVRRLPDRGTSDAERSRCWSGLCKSQTDVLSREAATRSVLGTWIAERPAEGIAYLQDHLEELSTGGLSDLARVWAEKDPAGLVAFALNQATPEQREAIGSPVGEWVKHYPEKFLPILRAAMQRPGWQDAWEAIAQDTWFGLENLTASISVL